MKQYANESLPNESEYYVHYLFYDDQAAIAKTVCDIQRAFYILNITLKFSLPKQKSWHLIEGAYITTPVRLLTTK